MNKIMIGLLSCLLALTSIADTTNTKTPIIAQQQRFLPTVGQHGMVTAAERLAAEAGLSMLKQGGNAVDAAVATGFALAVTFPRAGNLGGGGFMLIYLAEEKRNVFIDYREMAPAKATADMFLKPDGTVDKQREYFSHMSAGVPGTVAGLVHAQKHYGKLPLATVIKPAIKLAAQGFPVSYALASSLKAREERLRKDPASARNYFKSDGSDWVIGDTIKQPDLAWTLKNIARHGSKGFYEGKVAQRIADDMAANDGLITLEDLANYEIKERTPVSGTYNGYTVVSAPPPSSGGVHILQMLNILEGYDLKKMGHNSAAYVHRVAEAMKLAYADRSKYLGDPDFFPVPVAQLTDKNYAEKQRLLIKADKATPSVEVLPGRELPKESFDTTHFSTADQYGNMVSNTYTINFSYGSHISVPGVGILLNNEMADFAAKPGTANAFGLVQGESNRIEPRKRPLSSMSPTLVFKDNQPWLATGSPGGSLIITAVLQTLLNTMTFDMNIAAAAAAPRVHHQWLPDQLLIENGVSPDTLALLKLQGHPIKTNVTTLGRTQSIMREDGWLFGATDTRRHQGWVAAY